MPLLNVSEIPGYIEAVQKERLTRDVCFLGVTESIGSFEVLPMTLRHLLILRTSANPLLLNEWPSPLQLASFLWILNPVYSPAGKGRRKFMRRCRGFVAPGKPLFNTKRNLEKYGILLRNRLECLMDLSQKAKAYISEALQDRPPRVADPPGSGYSPSYYSEVASICYVMGRECHFSQQETLNTPVKCIFQYLKQMQDGPLCNPSDDVRAKWLTELNREKN